MGTNYHNAWAASVTQFTAASMNPAIAALDKAITYATKSPILHCDGEITWSNGTLTWTGTIRILFNTEAGLVVQNMIAAGSIAIADNQFCYVDLSETNDAALTMAVAAVTTNAASNFLTIARLVLAYRNTTNDELYPVFLPVKLKDPNKMVQTLTDAASVTINWSLGSTALITLDRALTTFAMTGAYNGQRCVLVVKQYAGIGAIAFGAEARGGTDLVLPPTLTAVADKEDYFGFIYRVATAKYDYVSMSLGY
jgi:hypothetical protein